MNTKRKPNAMLIELVIVILFFSLSAGIILQLFVAAHDRTTSSTVDTAALLIAEDFAERFAASDLPADVYLAEAGFVLEEDLYTRQTESNGRTLTINATSETTATEAGLLDRLQVTVLDGSREAVSLPVSRYLPREDVP